MEVKGYSYYDLIGHLTPGLLAVMLLSVFTLILLHAGGSGTAGQGQPFEAIKRLNEFSVLVIPFLMILVYLLGSALQGLGGWLEPSLFKIYGSTAELLLTKSTSQARRLPFSNYIATVISEFRTLNDPDGSALTSSVPSPEASILPSDAEWVRRNYRSILHFCLDLVSMHKPEIIKDRRAEYHLFRALVATSILALGFAMVFLSYVLLSRLNAFTSASFLSWSPIVLCVTVLVPILVKWYKHNKTKEETLISLWSSRAMILLAILITMIPPLFFIKMGTISESASEIALTVIACLSLASPLFPVLWSNFRAGGQAGYSMLLYLYFASALLSVLIIQGYHSDDLVSISSDFVHHPHIIIVPTIVVAFFFFALSKCKERAMLHDIDVIAAAALLIEERRLKSKADPSRGD